MKNCNSINLNFPRQPKIVDLFIKYGEGVKHARFDRACSIFSNLALVAYILDARGIAGFSMELQSGL